VPRIKHFFCPIVLLQGSIEGKGVSISKSHSDDDIVLLARFAESRDEAAFRGLVEKYTGLVYGVAYRKLGQKQAAKEVCQNIFAAMAQKAEALLEKRSLGAWLHRARPWKRSATCARTATTNDIWRKSENTYPILR